MHRFFLYRKFVDLYAKTVAFRLGLTDAEPALTRAQTNYLEAVYDYLSSRITLERSNGITGQ